MARDTAACNRRLIGAGDAPTSRRMIEHIADGVEWSVLPGLSAYPETIAAMEERAAAIRDGSAREAIWLLEHPPLYTAGTSAAAGELLLPDRFPVHRTGRGGRYTYHGPGQRVGYLMLDLDRRGRDVRRFVHALEDWLIATLAALGIAGRAEPGRVGIWVEGPAGEAKIGAIGVRIRRWVSLHGFAVNLSPDLSHFTGIVPCGIFEFPVTSAAMLGAISAFDAFDTALFHGFPDFLRALGDRHDGRGGDLAGEAAFRLST